LIANLLALSFSVLFIILAMQAEPITQVLGFTAGAMLGLATLARWNKSNSK
jgi:glycopeptide antibiotics resistance protein